MLRAVGRDQEDLHGQAAQLAVARFGRQVFVRAVVEVSNFCRENCEYCGMRRANRSLDRYRAKLEPIAELLVHHRPSSVTDINLQTGEDPKAVREIVLPLIEILKKETPLGISVCLGTLDPDLYRELQNAGASIYIMKFELANADRYREFQAPGTFSERIDHIHFLASNGWHVSSGFIAGLPGQSDEELLDNFALADRLPLEGCSVSPFIPGGETPLARSAKADIDLTLNCMAALRLMKPGWIIPSVSALDLAEPSSGYRRGLRTGANLVTINMTPSEIRQNYLLYTRDRCIMTEERILNAIAAENLKPSQEGLAEFYRSKASALRATDQDAINSAAA